MKRDLAIRALDMAKALRRPPECCIHHTDRGSQYCSHHYQKKMNKHGFKVPVSGNGNYYDSAVVETFFKILKAELILCSTWRTGRKVEMALFEYFNGFYNPRRRHSTLHGKSLIVFEKVVAYTRQVTVTKSGQNQTASPLTADDIKRFDIAWTGNGLFAGPVLRGQFLAGSICR